MAFNHRKLFPDPANKNLRDGCAKYCDPLQNREYICPAECFNACFPVCQAIITIQSPPPPPFSLVPPTPTPNTTTDYYPNKSHKHNLSLIISVTLASIFLIFCCYYFYRMQTAWYRSTGTADTQGGEESHGDLSDEYHRSEVDHPIWYIRTVGLQPSLIKAITICKYKRGDGLVEGTECSVCLNEFQEGENLRLLPKCNHAFHQSCIDTWLGSHISCPMCRGSVVRCPAAALPAREEGVYDSGTIERNQRGTPEINNNLETRRERENESYELRVRIQGEGDLQTENDSENQEFPTEEVLEVADIHPARRSNSVDSFSATITSAAATTDAHSRGQSVGNSGTLSDKANESDITVVPKGVDANEKPSING